MAAILIFITTNNPEGFLISDCGIMGYQDGDLSHSHFPLLPNLYIKYTSRRTSDLDSPINAFLCPEEGRNVLNEIMIAHATDQVFTSQKPSPALVAKTMKLIGRNAPQPPVRDGNEIHFGQQRLEVVRSS